MTVAGAVVMNDGTIYQNWVHFSWFDYGMGLMIEVCNSRFHDPPLIYDYHEHHLDEVKFILPVHAVKNDDDYIWDGRTDRIVERIKKGMGL